MIYNNIELHNVEEIVPVANGVRLQRIPEAVRKNINEKAQFRYLQPNNCEIRFVSDDPEVSVTLSSEGENNATVYFGCFDSAHKYEINKEPVTITLCMPERLRLIDKKYWKDLPFAPNVYRIILGNHKPGSAPIILHDIQGENIRPPQIEEKPAIRYLAYGTSITHGNYCSTPQLCYAAQTAWHIGADLINLGTGGSCYCEPVIADHIAERTDWDIASLAVSVNMLQHDFSVDEFKERTGYMIDKVAGANPEKLIVCITLYPFFRDLGICKVPPTKKWLYTPDEYRQALREVVDTCQLPNVHLIEGPEVFGSIGGLSFDLIHPGDNGMIELGRNLAAKLKVLYKQQIRLTEDENVCAHS
jgi:hypothetical protein